MPMTQMHAYESGWDAFNAGAQPGDNPYKENHLAQLHSSWARGYREAKEKKEKDEDEALKKSQSGD